MCIDGAAATMFCCANGTGYSTVSQLGMTWQMACVCRKGCGGLFTNLATALSKRCTKHSSCCVTTGEQKRSEKCEADLQCQSLIFGNICRASQNATGAYALLA